MDTGLRPLFVFAATTAYTWFVVGADQPRAVGTIAGVFFLVPFVIFQWLAAKKQADRDGRRNELRFTFAIFTHFTAGFGVALALVGQRQAAFGAIACVVALFALERVGEKMLDRQT